MGEGGQGGGGRGESGGAGEGGDRRGGGGEGRGTGESGEGGHVARAAWLYWTVVSLHCAVLRLDLAILRVFSKAGQSNTV